MLVSVRTENSNVIKNGNVRHVKKETPSLEGSRTELTVHLVVETP